MLSLAGAVAVPCVAMCALRFADFVRNYYNIPKIMNILNSVNVRNLAFSSGLMVCRFLAGTV